MEFAEEVREFLIESNENLGVLDQEIVELETNPADEKLIASVFRTIHTIKGTSGFFGFDILGGVTHVAENILGQVREKQRSLTPELVSLVLQTVDAVKQLLGNIEERGEEGEDVYQDLRKRLDDAYKFKSGSETAEPVVREQADEPVQAQVRVDVAGVAEVIEYERSEALSAAPMAQKSAEAAGGASSKSGGGSAGSSSNNTAAGSTIRVDVNLLDKLMNLVGELVLARNQILQGGDKSGASHGASQRLNLITSELQEGVMRTRMQPIGVVWNKLPRVVRDLASEVGKKIDIQMEGAETDLDKTIIEAIKDPLTHIVRNSCDHGIEAPEVRVAKGKSPVGTILLRAYHEGGHVNIEVSDDGAGINPERIKNKAIEKGLVRAEQTAQMSEWEALRLIFLPGFSTAEKVTSISGRGVGMDVVKTNIEKIGGAVDLYNRPSLNGAGAGSTIKIKIPLTLAIIPGLIISVNRGGGTRGAGAAREDRFVIPQANLLELVRLEGTEDFKQIESIHGTQVYRRRGKLLPLTHLSRVLGLSVAKEPSDVLNIVIVQAEETAFGLVVDGVSDTQEIVVKALGKQLKALSCYVGATIMGDGKIALILDVPGLARLANILPQPLERRRAEARVAETAKDARQTLLLFRAGRFPRLVVALSMVARLEEFPTSKVEYAGGQPVLHYRGAILPLVSLGAMLDPGAPDPGMDGNTLQVIVFSEGSRHIGLVVDEILDILEEAITVKRARSSFGLLGSAVVGGKVTDFVDLGVLLEAASAGRGKGQRASAASAGSVLLVDPRKVSRGVLKGFLEMHGHHVLEAANEEDMLEMLSRVSVHTVVAAIADVGRHGLLDAIRRREERVPVLALVDSMGDGPIRSPQGRQFDGVVLRSDRDGLLTAVETLSEKMPTSAQTADASNPTELELAGSAT